MTDVSLRAEPSADPEDVRPDVHRPHVVTVVGATATGKSDLAVRLALELGAEVVNADSMQLYAGMDVGTAKLSVEERRGVPHHLLDVWPVTRTASVVHYQAEARSVVDQLLADGRSVVVVGGSGLYVRALLDDLDFPGTDPDVRAALEGELAHVGPAQLHARLAWADPEAAAKIGPANGRRIVRALEVVELRGSYTATLPEPRAHYARVTHVGLAVPRPELAGRIEQRVDHMWQAGLVEEVRVLAETYGLREGRTASRALGYAQVLRYLDGVISEAAAREETVHATRRFARRQESWFRRDDRIRWLPAGETVTDPYDAALRAVAGSLRSMT
jgi:tRNA dimethylallyltransferase